MAYQVLADATMVLHFAFLAYVVAGGFLAWRWPQAIWPHLLAAGWGASTIVFRLTCPLTWLEDWARRRAGGSGLGPGFIDTYLTGIVYPERYAGLLQLLAGAAVTVSWIGVLLRTAAHRGPAPTLGRPRHHHSKGGPQGQEGARNPTSGVDESIAINRRADHAGVIPTMRVRGNDQS